MGGVRPANQRLSTGDAPVACRHLRLQVDVELLLLERRACGEVQVPAPGCILVELGRVPDDAELVALRLVHGRVGTVQEAGAVVALVRPPSRPEAGADLEGDPAELHTARERLVDLQDPFVQVELAVRGSVGEQHRELVTAEPGDHVGRPGGARQAAGDLDEELVAHLVTERVVDLLEAVEIDHDHRTAALVVGEARRQGDLEAEPVRQAGQRIVLGLRLEFLDQVVVGQAGAQGVGERPEQPDLVGAEVVAHPEPVGDEEHPLAVDLAEDPGREHALHAETAQEFEHLGSLVVVVEEDHRSIADGIEQQRGDLVGRGVDEGVVDEQPQRRVLLDAAGEESRDP